MVDMDVRCSSLGLWFMIYASSALCQFRNANYVKYVNFISEDNINGSNINIRGNRGVQKQHAIPCKESKFLFLRNPEFQN